MHYIISFRHNHKDYYYCDDKMSYVKTFIDGKNNFTDDEIYEVELVNIEKENKQFNHRTLASFKIIKHYGRGWYEGDGTYNNVVDKINGGSDKTIQLCLSDKNTDEIPYNPKFIQTHINKSFDDICVLLLPYDEFWRYQKILKISNKTP